MINITGNNFKDSITCRSKNKDNGSNSHETRLLPDSFNTRLRQNIQKTTSAIIDYPVKGLKGDVNTNFYEFLSMGIIPYLAGSGMFMLVFNVANKYLDLFAKEKARIFGSKMALGVVLYGLFKTISKNFVTKPIKMATGVNIDMPYENVTYSLPKGTGKDANIDILYQQRKVFDSKEFYRKDLLEKNYFDNVAKKLGLGENLNDSVSEVSPIIQNIVSTATTAKDISSYGFAALGVAMATQNSWIGFFNSVSNRNKLTNTKNMGFIQKCGLKLSNFAKNTLNISKSFLSSFCKSFAELWHGTQGTTGFMKNSGKLLIGLVFLGSAYLTGNSIIKAKKMAQNINNQSIDKSKESVVI